jgi:hypothetical protein
MTNIITIGRRLIPPEQIALVEPFDPSANPQFKNDKGFESRVVLINRESVLTEDTPQTFAQANSFRMLADDGVATNPAIKFKVETFAPTEGFKPAKPYVTRLLWRDQDGKEQSKLLLTKAETVIAVALRGENVPGPDPETARRPAPRPPRRKLAPRAQQV